MKFKYFFDCNTGVPPSNEINEWLEENKGIEIKYIYGSGDSVYIMYEEKLI
jgi:hypothetical protein